MIIMKFIAQDPVWLVQSKQSYFVSDHYFNKYIYVHNMYYIYRESKIVNETRRKYKSIYQMYSILIAHLMNMWPDINVRIERRKEFYSIYSHLITFWYLMTLYCIPLLVFWIRVAYYSMWFPQFSDTKYVCSIFAFCLSVYVRIDWRARNCWFNIEVYYLLFVFGYLICWNNGFCRVLIEIR